jgi:hypothetical protein
VHLSPLKHTEHRIPSSIINDKYQYIRPLQLQRVCIDVCFAELTCTMHL